MYLLKNNRTGEEAVYKTELEISEKNGILNFRFIAENSQYYCPEKGYNGIHARGDACEILIGSDPERKVYYEIEISPKNEVLLAKMEYCGITEAGKARLNIGFVKDCFLQSKVELTETGYIVEVSFNKKDILTGDGEVYFNAYRLETDGGTMEKHLFALNPTLCNRFHTPSCYLYLKDYLK
ncbi:MAG: hypothetical protein IJX98_02140 [Clostridia bacterium]|nr:hypothetical protein [Clostridia bacterium]